MFQHVSRLQHVSENNSQVARMARIVRKHSLIVLCDECEPLAKSEPSSDRESRFNAQWDLEVNSDLCLARGGSCGCSSWRHSAHRGTHSAPWSWDSSACLPLPCWGVVTPYPAGVQSPHREEGEEASGTSLLLKQTLRAAALLGCISHATYHTSAIHG